MYEGLSSRICGEKTCPVGLTRPTGDFKFHPSCPLKLVEMLTIYYVHKHDTLGVISLSQICLKRYIFLAAKVGPLTKMLHSDGTSRYNYPILMTGIYSRCKMN